MQKKTIRRVALLFLLQLSHLAQRAMHERPES
jgi:hypothetical protein